MEDHRHGVRHLIKGPAFLVAEDGRMTNVTLLDLSAEGAKVTRPEYDQSFIGCTYTLAGPSMPWERHAEVVAIGEHEIHLHFLQDPPPEMPATDGKA